MSSLARDRAAVLTLTLAAPVALNLGYLLGVRLGHLPACVPYIAGCTTTSSTGHAWPERAVFLCGMLVTALLCAWFWRRCSVALSTPAPRCSGALRWLGVVAAVSLAGYAVCIGQPGDTLRLLRRIGIDGFFLANYAAQVIVLTAAARCGVRSGARRAMLALCLALPLLALAGEVAKAVGLAKRPVDNIVEWNAIVLVCAYYAAAGHGYFNRLSGRAASPLA